MFYLIYNTISIFLFLPVIIFHIYRSVSRGRKAALAERLGWINEKDLALIGGRKTIWLHAVSVGETIAAKPLLKALRSQYPLHAILISNTTETGRGVAEGLAEKDLCIYFPFDFSPAVSHLLDRIRPELIIIMETEIWPNFNRAAHKRGIPLLLANGRISDRSFKGYQRFSWFFKHPLRQFTSIQMQSSADAERIKTIGAPDSIVHVAGNLKYDIPCSPATTSKRVALREKFSIPSAALVITAASTHPGEDEIILDCYRRLQAGHSNLFLVLVPRHPERAGEIAQLANRLAIGCTRRTSLQTDHPSLACGEMLLVDTIGEMLSIYALSDMAFVGGSLVATGGHNLLEPASLGTPCLFGPPMTNFREIAAMVLDYQAGIQVDTGQRLTEEIGKLIDTPERRLAIGQNGLKMVMENGGATERHMRAVAELL